MAITPASYTGPTAFEFVSKRLSGRYGISKAIRRAAED